MNVRAPLIAGEVATYMCDGNFRTESEYCRFAVSKGLDAQVLKVPLSMEFIHTFLESLRL